MNPVHVSSAPFAPVQIASGRSPVDGGGGAVPGIGVLLPLVVSCAAILGGTTFMGGLLMASRRLAGAIDSEVSGAGLAAAVGAGMALVACTDAAAAWSRNGLVAHGPSLTLASRIGARIGLFAIFASVADLATNPVATFAVGLAGLATIAWPMAPVARRLVAASLDRPPRVSPEDVPGERTGTRSLETAGSPRVLTERRLAGRSLFASADAWPEARLVQRIERYETATATNPLVETAVGRVVARFAEGSRTAVAHVGFCPPFPTTPGVTVTTDCEGLEVTVAAAEVLPWGVRIECRLEEPAEEAIEVEVDLVAVPPESP